MSVTPTVFPTAAELGRVAAERIADLIAEAAARGERFLLGCPSGRSPECIYSALADVVRERGIDLSHVCVVMMDEYLTDDAAGRKVCVATNEPYSCVGFAERKIAAPLNAAAAVAGVAGLGAIWSPDPLAPSEYDARIKDAGGIDFFILASGASDGHIAFNQPGTDRAVVTHVTELGERTRTDNLSTFPEFGVIENVPTHGVTVGLSTIADLSREVVMVLVGSDKSEAFSRLSTADALEPDWPATVFAECQGAQLFADAAAAGQSN